MAGTSWPHYPPCMSDGCTSPSCCGLDPGHKFTWPKLIGKKGEVAKAVIERETPSVTVVFLGPDMVRLDNFCCNRVYVIVDEHGNVIDVPTIG